MAKHPVPGRVKTRLAAELGDETACALQRAFLLDLADRLRALPYTVTWAFWPPSAPFATLLGGGRCRPQSGDDLGERMRGAIEAEFADGGGTVVVLGADVPHVDLACVRRAVLALAAGADVVLGPALDGGYYLIGLRSPAPALFENIAWGTDQVLRATVARAERLGLRVELVAESFDVDQVGDLARLRAALATADLHLPRTRAVLDGLRHTP
jgi:rSAM/selenodomain-associated transferase 1